MIQEQKKLPEFTINGAVFSVLYDMVNDNQKRRSDYERMWKWSRQKVRSNWPRVEPLAALLYLKSQQPSNNHKNAMEGTVLRDSQPSNNQHIGSYNNIIPITTASPNPSASNKNLNNPNTRKQKIFGSEEDPYRYSKKCLHRLSKLGVIYPSLLTNPEQSIQNGARVFDKLNRIDGKSWDRIASVMKWLLAEDNWWIESLNFRSPAKLRKRNDEGATFFEVFEGKMDGAAADKQKKSTAAPISATSTYTPSYSAVEQRDDSDLESMTPEEEELMRRLSA